MKLLRCNECRHVFSITTDHVRTCECGKTKGQYDDDRLNAWYSGPATPLGFANGSYNHARLHQPVVGPGALFTAFVIEQRCPTFRKVDS